MTRYSATQLAVAIALAAVGVFAAFIRVGDALVQQGEPDVVTTLVLVGVAWFAGSVVVAVVIGRAIARADRREVQAAMDRHPAGRERHLRVVKAS